METSFCRMIAPASTPEAIICRTSTKLRAAFVRIRHYDLDFGQKNVQLEFKF